MVDEVKHVNKLADIRVRKDLTQQQVADALGVTVQAYQNYEYGKRDIKGTMLAKMADALDCTVSEILGLALPRSIRPTPSSTWCPHLGSIAAGTPREAIQRDGEQSWCPPPVLDGHPGVFTLTVRGDSMDLLFPDGCLAYVDPAMTEIDNGSQYAVLVNGFDSTVKTVYRVGNTVVLHPESSNPVHKDMTIDETDPDAPYFRVIGKVIWYAAPLE